MSCTLPEQECLPKVEQLLQRYGPRDVSKYDEFCLGYKNFGKVRVDCSFLFKKSKWGIIGGDAGTPGGVVYLNLTFNQPPNCRLTRATVTVTVDDRAEAEASEKTSRNPLRPLRKKRRPRSQNVSITTCGPRHITGEPQVKMVKTKINGTPHVEAYGFGGGGLGIDKEKQFVQTSRWALKGDIRADETLLNRVVQWELTENDLDNRPTHSNVFKAGFAFAHDKQPVVLKVEINGQLESTLGRLKEKMRFSGLRDDGRTQTAAALITFGRNMGWGRCLRALEKGLPHDMENENYQLIPVELPGPQQAVYGPAPMSSTSPALATLPTSRPSALTAGLEAQGGTLPALPQAQSSEVPPALLLTSNEDIVTEIFENGPSSNDHDPTKATLANLARFAQPATSRDSHVERGPQSSQARDGMSSTLSQRTSGTDPAPANDCDSESDKTTLVGEVADGNVDEKEAMRRMLELPMVMLLVRIIAWMVGMDVLKSVPEVDKPMLPMSPRQKRIASSSASSSPARASDRKSRLERHE